MNEPLESIPAAEGMVEAELGAKKKLNNEFCLNCGSKLINIYCHQCGQRDLPKRQTMSELIENFIGSFYSFESKFFRTVKFLLFKPGFLPVEYTAGKRETYYHPARAYAFISFIFFLLLFSLPDHKDKAAYESFSADNEKDLTESLEKIKDELKKSGLDSLKIDSIYKAMLIENSSVINIDGIKKKTKGKVGNTGFSLTSSTYATLREYDSIQESLPVSERDGWIMRKLTIRSIELNQRYKGNDGGKRFSQDFSQAFFDNFSKVLFFLLPIFALLLRLLYLKHDYYYSEHLVFAIYYYNFFYLAASLYLLLKYIPVVGGLLTLAIVIWIVVYIPLGMKRMYQQPWSKTIIKYSIFLIAFFVCLLTGIMGNLLAIVMYL